MAQNDSFSERVNKGLKKTGLFIKENWKPITLMVLTVITAGVTYILLTQGNNSDIEIHQTENDFRVCF